MSSTGCTRVLHDESRILIFEKKLYQKRYLKRPELPKSRVDPQNKDFLKGTVLMYRSISTGYRSIPALMLEICYVYGYIFTRPCAALLGENHAPKSSKCVQKNQTLELLESRVTLDQKIEQRVKVTTWKLFDFFQIFSKQW